MSKNKVNHPDHYNAYDIEVIDMMISIFGKKDTAIFCEINAFKYRMRMGLKGDTKIDLLKEQWYLNKKKELVDSCVQSYSELNWNSIKPY